MQEIFLQCLKVFRISSWKRDREVLGFIVITILLHFIHLTLYDSFYKCTCDILLHDLTWLDWILVLMFISQLIIIWATAAADEIYRWRGDNVCFWACGGAQHTTHSKSDPVQYSYCSNTKYAPTETATRREPDIFNACIAAATGIQSQSPLFHITKYSSNNTQTKTYTCVSLYIISMPTWISVYLYEARVESR